MAIRRMPAALFVARLLERWAAGDGYIMCATGQDPKKWSKTSWWFTQYEGKQRTKALYWREHAQRVWDCNGLAEGLYKDYAGVDIDTKARYNFAQWCGVKGSGMIPVRYRRPGAAVFWGDSAGKIHHVAYLVEPVDPKKPGGDWYLIEARGVMYGVVRTKLLSRKPDFWGLMDKYFDYGATADAIRPTPSTVVTAQRLLKNGCEGDDVKQLQANLIRLGYDLGRWGADGDFGDATELAVRAFQKAAGLAEDGIAGPLTMEAIDQAIAAAEKQPEDTEQPKAVLIQGGNCWIRTAPDVENSKKLGVAHAGDKLPWGGVVSEDGWLLVSYDNQNAWVSGKYARIAA